jgi:hypothetical protein
MDVEQLSRVRGSVVPSMDDTWADIAGRALPATPEAEAVGLLQSWNLHVFMRSSRGARDKAHPFLPTDVIFVEPPLGQA